MGVSLTGNSVSYTASEVVEEVHSVDKESRVPLGDISSLNN